MARFDNGEKLAIFTEKLTKYYGEIRGIEGVNLRIEKGTIHGFLGPNGAGKTTTIRILVGLLRSSSGTALINGFPAGSIEAKKVIGYIPSEFELYSHFTVGEYLSFIETIRGADSSLKKDLIDRFNVDVKKNTKELSRGNKQKVAIVQAFMHNPPIIIADEPTVGLDPLMQEEFQALMREYVKKGNTIFISSHILSEVQETCEFVSIIKDGKIISTGNIENLLLKIPRKIVLTITNKNTIDFLNKKFGEKNVITDKNKVTVYFEGNALKVVLNELTPIINDIRDILLPEPTLEELFLPMYKKKEGGLK